MRNLERFYNSLKKKTMNLEELFDNYVKALEKDKKQGAVCNLPSRSSKFIIRPGWMDSNTYLVIQIFDYLQTPSGIVYGIEILSDFQNPKYTQHTHHKGDILYITKKWASVWEYVHTIE